nr:PREDICTED: EF-hand calcium-binding domain-containing protein 12 [Latimeria chalumnae]|eukprot:XP_005997895.1 PREDICTED: EF-hand calcium-binding domain-containing protein 12 [Latimeria chalumnae]
MIQEEVFAVGNSMTDQLKQYKKRNLFQVLFYRVAARTFGAPKSRRRILIAPAMERAPGLAKIPSAAPEEPPEVEREGPPVPPKEEPRAPSPKAEFELGMEEEEVREYERYLAKRRELRRNLENLDDVLGWLRRKGDLSPLEAKELSRLQEQEARKGPQTQPALANQNADFPVDEKQVEELIAAVSSEGSDCIHYKDLVKAQKVWKQETRKPTKTQLRGTKSDGTFLSVVLDNESRTGRPILHSWVYPRGEKQETLGSMRRNTPGRRSVFLTAPAADVDEMVKRDQERRPRAKSIPGHLDLTKRSRLVQTGNPAVDSHCLPSTVPGKTGEKIDEYRMLCYQEYVKSLLLCQKYNIPLTQSLLEKALLYPGDRVLHASGRKLKIRQPGASLPSRSSFRTPNPVTSSEGVGAAQQGVPKTMMYRSLFRRKRHTGKKTVMFLSTGKAVIRSKIDNWMTFEEFEVLTRHLQKKHFHLLSADPNAFWPGQLLDKLHLYLPHAKQNGQDAIFSNTRQQPRANPGVYNNEHSWPISDQGYVTYGDTAMKKHDYH